MTTRARAPFPRAPWDSVLAALGAVGVVVFLIVAGVTAIPPILADRDARLSDGVVAVPVGDAHVVVPSGWIVTGDAANLGVRTPDTVLSADLTPAEGAPRDALQRFLDAELGAVPTATIGPFRGERLASGLTVVHSDVGADAVFAVVADGETALAAVRARVAPDRERADYRAALGQLLDGVRP